MEKETEVIDLCSDSEEETVNENCAKVVIVDVEYIEQPCSSSSLENIKVHAACLNAIQDFLNSIPVSAPISYEERAKLKEKLYKKYHELKSVTNGTVKPDIFKALEKKIKEASEIITLNPHCLWTQSKHLLNLMKPGTSLCIVNLVAIQENPNKETKLEKRKRKYEEKLEVLLKKIKKWDTSEADLDDEKNSAYLVKDRLVKRLMKYRKKLCQIYNCSSIDTGRPIHKRIPVEDITGDAQLNEGIFKYLNACVARNAHYFPNFRDTFKIIKKLMNTSPRLYPLEDSEVSHTARIVFESVAKILKKRRGKDLRVALERTEADDPALSNPDLAAQLEQNKKDSRNNEVMKEFAMLDLEGAEINDDNPDDRVPDSQNECSSDEDISMCDSDTENEDPGDKDKSETTETLNSDDIITLMDTQEIIDLVDSDDSDSDLFMPKKARLA